MRLFRVFRRGRQVFSACIGMWVGTVLGGSLVGAEREYGGYYTEQRLATIRSNIRRFAWGESLEKRHVAAAAPWVAMSDEQLWALVPGQKLPRCIDVTITREDGKTTRTGCLRCGEKIFAFGSAPYKPDFERLPWKLTCPSCGAVFPTNDFGAYYRSAIDEHGLFDPARGDRRLLFNTDHPDPSDPLHLYGVDDGFGFVDADGHTHKFVGYYAWQYWRYVTGGLSSLAHAYLCTGERVYAHKAAILLDRIADVYPEMDWSDYARRGWYHSDGDRGVGKIEGAIWETNVLRKLAEAYDAILSGTVDDTRLEAFLARQAQRWQLPGPKGTRDLFVRNVDERLLRCGYAAVVSGQISGNEGMHQMAVATCALALDSEAETGLWLDWLFAPDGGAIPGFIVGKFDRDGMTDEAAPNYAVFGGQLISQIAAKLSDYGGYSRHDLFRDYPQLGASLVTPSRMVALGLSMPNLGDSGATGLVSLAPAKAGSSMLGFRCMGDPAMAVAAWRTNGNSARGLGEEMDWEKPDALVGQVASIARAAGPRGVGGYLLSGYGLALLECGRPGSEFAVVCNYGRTTHHGHADTLNFDLFGFGGWLAPDQGYPEFATTNWPSRRDWTFNTISHNTVVVDGAAQERGWGGKVRLFAQLRDFGVVEIDGRAAYPGIEAYERLMLLIGSPDGGSAYVVDVFRVAGGGDHLLSFHGPPGEVTASGLEWNLQDGGTYAGPSVELASAEEGVPPGFSYLYNVRRAPSPQESFAVDWQVAPGYRNVAAKADVHLRLYAAGAASEVALADGDPPQNKPGNPRTIGYLLRRRVGDALKSTFVSVIEPYSHKPAIESVERVEAASEEQVVLRVSFRDGTVDEVLCNVRADDRLQIDGGANLHGKIGYVRYRAGGKMHAVLVDGRELTSGKLKLTSPGAYTGRVMAMNREMTGGGWILVDGELPVDGSLVGRTIHIENDNERDASYCIRGAARTEGGTRIDCGPVAFVRGFKGPTIEVRRQQLPASYSEGYLYDFELGAPFRIPLSAETSTDD